jgi:fatty-acyl-CoA synthase
MMEYQLTLPTILRRAETLFAHKEVVSRLPDKTIHRYT